MDRHRAADRVELAMRRALTAADVVEEEHRVAVLAELARRVAERRDEAAAQALGHGAQYADLARALGISRQAARQRFSPPREDRHSGASGVPAPSRASPRGDTGS
ncbi:hypothetical protein ER308_08850 [Egibacter rhizosphaerae]|uniref:Uncharacterized protein n=1 Tax=Egibacter rhizosphaerae TaxID=1670831 RepID=A0A411YEL1_9ACTN|nr:hypothetical protein [Egibacter rhizosphaerae]QBI19649.1 hypothetical protein ER308_08850 [Egibacter rhizosphaerae]